MKLVIAALVAALVSTACATDTHLRQAQKLALYRQHAGEPVPSIRYVGSVSGWTPLGDTDMALWTRPNQAYLLTFAGRCPDLAFATAISLSHQFHTIHARFDSIIPLGQAMTPIPCHIREIRPLDTRALRDAQREMRSDVRQTDRG